MTNSIVTPEQFARLVLNAQRTALYTHPGTQQTWVNARITTESIYDKHLSWASLSTVRKAANAAHEQGLIRNVSHHGARYEWAPSQVFLLQTITELMEENKALREADEHARAISA